MLKTYFENFHEQVNASYNTDCNCVACQSVQLKADGTSKHSKAIQAAATAAYKHLHSKGSYQPEDLTAEPPYLNLINATNNVFSSAIADNDMPSEMRSSLQKDAFIFSGLKTNAQVLEASSLLLNKEGNLQPYHIFEKEVLKINDAYNLNYLEAEYQFATSSAQMAAKWAGYDNEDERYNLQYRTANDERVRDSHAALHNTTLPTTDPFWAHYYPPNGWRCRCTAVQVRKGKFDVSDSKTAIAAGEKATTQLDKNGNNKLAIFRFNAGAERKLMPPKNPYIKIAGAKKAKKVLEEAFVDDSKVNIADIIKGDTVTSKHISDIMKEYASKYPDDFRNGLDGIRIVKSTGYMMQHGMAYIPRTGTWSSGTKLSISSHTFSRINFNPADEFKGALLAIKKKETLTFKQEYSVESLWHEILHAKTKTQPADLSTSQKQSMETLNQFCARHTYDQFLERLGGKAAHKNEIIKTGFGYSTWVKDFRETLKRRGIKEKTALADLMPILMKDYGSIRAKLAEYTKLK